MFSIAMAVISYAHFSLEKVPRGDAPSARRKKTIEVVSEYFFGSPRLEVSKGAR